MSDAGQWHTGTGFRTRWDRLESHKYVSPRPSEERPDGDEYDNRFTGYATDATQSSWTSIWPLAHADRYEGVPEYVRGRQAPEGQLGRGQPVGEARGNQGRNPAGADPTVADPTGSVEQTPEEWSAMSVVSFSMCRRPRRRDSGRPASESAPVCRRRPAPPRSDGHCDVACVLLCPLLIESERVYAPGTVQRSR